MLHGQEVVSKNGPKRRLTFDLRSLDQSTPRIIMKIIGSYKAVDNADCKESWINLLEASRRTGYSISTLRRLVRLRKLHGRREGNKWFITWASCENYVDTTARGRKINQPMPLNLEGLRLWLPKSRSKSTIGLDILVNGVQIHLMHLHLEYPRSPADVIKELAPGMPSFYSISVRGVVSTVRWLEQEFASGTIQLTVLKPNFPTVLYTLPVESVCETALTPEARYLSAAFGFYRADVFPQIEMNVEMKAQVTLPADIRMP